MLYFPQSFFESEIREDFLVDSTMKAVWAAGLEVLAFIASVCEKYQIPWFADWGTLLGAVRHQGYVPWDDDMDICLLKDDYNRLMEVLPKEMPEGWVLRYEGSTEPQEQYWACLFNSHGICIEKKFLETFHGCPFIVGVDIFQLDYIPRDEKFREWELAVFKLIHKTVLLLKKKEKTPEDEKDIRDALKVITRETKQKIDKSKDIISQLWRIADKLTSTVKEQDADYVANFLSYETKGRLFDKHWYDDTDYLPFETVELPVPINYDEVLKVEYGNYMVFERNTQSHDYPYYKKELEELRRMVKEMEDKANNGNA